MIEIKAIKEFRDRDTNILHKEGDTIKKTNERAEQIIAGGYAQEVTSVKENKEVKQTKEDKAAAKVDTK